MNGKRIVGRIMQAVALMLLLNACTGGDPASTGGSSSESGGRAERYVVGSGIRMEDITEFYFTYDSSTNPPEFQRYRFYVEDGAYMFYHETREGGHWPLTEEDITVSGSMELTEDDREAFFDYLKNGRVKKRKNDANSGDSGPFLYLYWNGDRSKYQVFEFSSYRKQEAFEEYCIGLKTQCTDSGAVLPVNRTDQSVTHYYASIEECYDSVERNDAGFHFHHRYDVLSSTDAFLSDAMARALQDLASQYETESAEMCAKAEREAEENEDFSAYVKDDCTLFRADSRVLSFARKRDTQNNGSAAFANVRDKSFTTYNFDPESGKQIPLTDVVLDIDAFSALAAGRLYERYVDGSPNPMAKDLFESKEKLANDIGQILTGNWLYADQVYTWSPSYLGVKLLFFDEIASYEGVQAFRDNGGYYILPDCFEVTVPYSMAPEIFEASYTDLPENYFAEIETETDYLLKTAGGQTKLRVEAPTFQDESGVGSDTTLYTGEIHVLLDDEETVFENTEISPYMNFDTAVYLAQNEGKTFLYLGQEGEYGEWFVEVYEIKDGALQHVGHMEGFEPDDFPPLDPACFHTRIITGILNNPFAESRVSCVRMNTLGDDGMPAPHFMAPDTPSDYRVTGLQPSYTLAVPVTAPYWDGQGVAFMESGTKTYPAGTVIRMTHTDNKSYVLLQPDGTEEYIIAYSEKSAYGPWPEVTRIGGTPLETAFVPPYAAYTEPADAAIALETDVWDGYWWNPDTGDELWMHGFRGEFELTFGTTGDYHAGTIIYNGNPEHPVYTLKDDTGYNLADLYYLEGEYMPDDYRMMIMFHFSEGDVIAVFYQPKG